MVPEQPVAPSGGELSIVDREPIIAGILMGNQAVLAALSNRLPEPKTGAQRKTNGDPDGT